MSVLYNDSHESKSFETDAVTIKKSMTEYFNKQSGLPFILTQQSMGEISMVNLVTCLFSLV